MKKINIIDEFILNLISLKVRNPFLDKIMSFITKLGDMGAVWILISVYVIVIMKEQRIGLEMLSALAITTLIGEGIIKHIFQRQRPCRAIPMEKMLIKKPLSYSFPSGHTASSFAVMTVMVYYFKSTALIWVLLAVLIGISRIYVHVHYPTDVAVGAILGYSCAKLILYIFTVI